MLMGISTPSNDQIEPSVKKNKKQHKVLFGTAWEVCQQNVFCQKNLIYFS